MSVPRTLPTAPSASNLQPPNSLRIPRPCRIAQNIFSRAPTFARITFRAPLGILLISPAPPCYLHPSTSPERGTPTCTTIHSPAATPAPPPHPCPTPSPS